MPQAKGAGQLTQAQQSHLLRIQDQSLLEAMDVVFASGRRSIESLRIAYATTDRIATPAPTRSFKKLPMASFDCLARDADSQPMGRLASRTCRGTLLSTSRPSLNSKALRHLPSPPPSLPI